MTDPSDAKTRDLFAAKTAPARLGIIGGGQLARMTALAALPLGCDVVFLERDSICPAAGLAPRLITVIGTTQTRCSGSLPMWT